MLYLILTCAAKRRPATIGDVLTWGVIIGCLAVMGVFDA